MAVWTQDEAGPYQTMPSPGQSGPAHGRPKRQPHEYCRQGTAKLLTLFHPKSGALRAKGGRQCPNAVLHPWLQQACTTILAGLPPPQPVTEPGTNHAQWPQWQASLRSPLTLPQELPTLRRLLVFDPLQGHRTPRFVLWLFAQGIMPLYTPLGGSWLNMTESGQRLIGQRAWAGQSPQTPAQIIG